MPAEPSKYEIACHPDCNLNPEKIGQDAANAILTFFESGMTGRALARKAGALIGREIPSTSMQRHLKHYKPLREEDPEPEEAQKRASDVEILDEIITAGYRNSKNWKPSIKDTLDAMKLKQAMTGGSAFEDFMGALNAALDLPPEDDEEAPEAPEALGTPDEVPEPDDD
ncbi:MAG TPA: hypothetical protein VLA89_15630 [Gemmatimonadales bacterium]|nr:hypothetical protein [Gemmatimonadales bacterium]